jgi:hypothetical protein
MAAAADPLTAIHQALREGLAAILPEGRDALLTRTRLILATLTTALITWVDGDGAEGLPELVDLAFARCGAGCVDGVPRSAGKEVRGELRRSGPVQQP